MLVKSHVFGFDNKSAPVGHCIPCIDGKVHQDLFHLRGVGIYGGEIIGQDEFYLYHLGYGAGEHFLQLLYSPVQVERTGLTSVFLLNVSSL